LPFATRLVYFQPALNRPDLRPVIPSPRVFRLEPRCCCCRDGITPKDCPYLREGEEELLFDRRRRFLQRCLECPRFLENILKASHDGCDGLIELFPYAVEGLLEQRAELRSLAGQVEARQREIRFLHEVSTVLQTSVDVDEVIAMALTAITAGEGFGLNRAILLLVDRERQFLRGHIAVGPRWPEEAARIWHEIAEHQYSLREMGRLFYEEKMALERERFRDLLDLLCIPLSRGDHPFVATLNEQVSRHVRDLAQEPGIDRTLAEALGVRELLLVPLISQSRRIGLLLADNVINGRPITEEDRHSLETFALPVSFAIERAALYGRLREELEKVKEANQRLREQQEQIVRMEKMALVGQITSNIAHSIRNPLTIIGGFARNLIKATPPDDAKRQFIESIVREADRLEDTLREVLSYSEALHPSFDLWDVNQLVAAVFAGLRDDFALAGIDCRLDFTQGLPPVRLDYKMLSYCLRTLTRSILAGMTGRGPMAMRTSRVEGELRVVIAGYGGEAPAPQALPYFSTDEAGQLGLSLCDRIIKEHGARLDAGSEPDGGIAFTIRLPIPKEE
jgi:hypothetical protein